MKLSEEAKGYIFTRAGQETYNQVLKLEADSELLNTLLKLIMSSCYLMMYEKDDKSFEFVEFTYYGTLLDANGESPRAAIEAFIEKRKAIKE